MMKIAYLTDNKSWVKVFDGSNWTRIEDFLTEELLLRIKRSEIALIWRSDRVAEFYYGDADADYVAKIKQNVQIL